MAYQLVRQAVRPAGDGASARTISWFGLDLSLGFALTQRAFEIWTHADDIRAALGLPLVPPPPASSLETMSSTVVEMIPIMLAVNEVTAEGRLARIVLTGDGGGAYDIALGFADTVGSPTPDVTVELDVVDFCRAVGDRLPADGHELPRHRRRRAGRRHRAVAARPRRALTATRGRGPVSRAVPRDRARTGPRGRPSSAAPPAQPKGWAPLARQGSGREAERQLLIDERDRLGARRARAAGSRWWPRPSRCAAGRTAP